MPSPFPGMDPYLELPDSWPDFHSGFINVMSEQLVRLLRPRYSVRIEERVYLEFEPARREASIRPDPTVTSQDAAASAPPPRSSSTAVPVKVAVVLPDEIREVSLTIRHVELENVVAVVELLSPSNKRADSVGRETYLEKRNAILKSRGHLVEIDLLRAGERMPMREALPPGDYHVIVSRREKRPDCDVYSWKLREALPEIAIPLAAGDPDVALNLQSVLDTAYDRAGYDYTVDYKADPPPPMRTRDVEWVRERVAKPRA